MRTAPLAALLAVLVLFAPLRADDDETAAKLAEQKKNAVASWNLLEIGDPASHETQHLRLLAPKEMEAKLKTIGASLEKYHALAMSTLKHDKGSYPGKITVFLLPNVATFPSFSRLVDRRRPEPGQTSSFSAEDTRLRVAAAPTKTMPAEVRAGEMIASLLLARKAGISTPLPEWVGTGFGRATTYRLVPKAAAVATEKKKARALLKKHGAAGAWDGSVGGEEAAPLHGALAEFMAYGPGAARFLKFVDAFRPGEGMESKTTATALDAIGVSSERIDKQFRTWLK